MVFSEDNSLVGVIAVTASLMLLERDLTASFLGNTLKFIGINLLIGIGAFIANTNMWIAIPINFCIIFFLSYTLLFYLRKPLYLPFSLQYLFLVSSPVSIDRLPLRLVALVCGALCIMIVQFLTNRKRLTKQGRSLLNAICSDLVLQIDQIIKKEESHSISERVQNSIITLRKLIYDKRENEFYLTEEGRIKLNLSVSLEKISVLLDNLKHLEVSEHLFKDIKTYLKLAEETFIQKGATDQLEAHFNNLLNTYDFNSFKNLEILELFNNMGFLKDSLKELHTLSEDSHQFAKKTKINYYQNLLFDLKHMRKNSMKYSYALRLAVGITISFFITDLLGLSEGKWIAFTVLSIIQPIYEASTQKSSDRVFATFVGALLTSVLFTIFKDTTIRTLLLMSYGYIGSYFTAYRYTTIFVTASAIGSAALASGTVYTLTFNRILYVIIGTGIALLLNKFLLPYKVEDNKKELNTLYEKTIYSMISEISQTIQGNENAHKIKNLFLTTSLLEDRMRMNAQTFNNPEYMHLIEQEKLLITNIYELYIWITTNKIKSFDIKYVMEDIKLLLITHPNDLEKTINGIKKLIEIAQDVSDRIVLNMIIQILREQDAMNLQLKLV